ncbi:uncharacterized protein PHALS_15273 [Plasmopara halstedii]|uniref:Uncharacterized protein n=1 Tax=Plasmopara halstedii TaxID=4781 RepID=A0A0P1B6A3_PLAHL|nr:uncharacterized protein PHALS_15273 [Plasmopara halstedii]CEG50367.1 hypothetical protein PHALS_15273 [Plasmopara halstedii]|eukprot:XP_024586736.1 hypothetical protein PHALS_15273 [Plasmopara halstedii]
MHDDTIYYIGIHSEMTRSSTVSLSCYHWGLEAVSIRCSSINELAVPSSRGITYPICRKSPSLRLAQIALQAQQTIIAVMFPQYYQVPIFSCRMW